MAKSFVGGDADQKAFVKIFDSLTGKYNRWQVWQDMIWMIACSISNTVDRKHFDKREEMFTDIAKKYSDVDIQKFKQLLEMLIESMESRVNRGDYGDFLGEMFMNLNLGNELGGQFFTPYHVCLMMAKSTINDDRLRKELNRCGYISCADFACGAGATLIAAAECMKELGINYQEQCIFAGQDIDSTTALMCYIQLSLLGCAGYVVIGNSLIEPMTGHALFGEDSERCWKTPMYYLDKWDFRRQAESMRQIIHIISKPVVPKQHFTMMANGDSE